MHRSVGAIIAPEARAVYSTVLVPGDQTLCRSGTKLARIG